MRDWVWQALGTLPADEQLTVLLRYFTRCESYDAIARITGVPVGTVRSRLNRARAHLADALGRESPRAVSSHSALEAQADRRELWEGFYRAVHERPAPAAYRDLYADDVDVRDRSGHWLGVETWSAHEREAISLGVRATVVDVLAGRHVTVVEVDFANPPAWPGHCPSQATFVHRLHEGRSRRLRIHYPLESAGAGYAQPMSV
jgi:RNA polymerase sigma-70 factor (ECF subfamily)